MKLNSSVLSFSRIHVNCAKSLAASLIALPTLESLTDWSILYGTTLLPSESLYMFHKSMLIEASLFLRWFTFLISFSSTIKSLTVFASISSEKKTSGSKICSSINGCGILESSLAVTIFTAIKTDIDKKIVINRDIFVTPLTIAV